MTPNISLEKKLERLRVNNDFKDVIEWVEAQFFASVKKAICDDEFTDKHRGAAIALGKILETFTGRSHI